MRAHTHDACIKHVYNLYFRSFQFDAHKTHVHRRRVFQLLRASHCLPGTRKKNIKNNNNNNHPEFVSFLRLSSVYTTIIIRFSFFLFKPIFFFRPRSTALGRGVGGGNDRIDVCVRSAFPLSRIFVRQRVFGTE